MVTVGDYVQFDMNEDGTGVITEVEPRENFISRKAPKEKGSSYRGERLEQVVAANIDNLFIVNSISEPAFNNKRLDRFLVVGESSHLNIIILINKIDLDDQHIADAWEEFYSEIGYTVFVLSAKKEIGLENIKTICSGKKNLFWGPSGVGKSTILNKLYPSLNFKTGRISNWIDRGTHTTVTSTLVKVDVDTYVIDTPGLREIEPYGIQKQDLGHYFIEFVDYIPDCKFSTCTHNHEPGCAVIKAAEEGFISGERYESYLRMLETIEEDINF
jgi:ribosome biogenesis GTPase